MSSKTAKNNNQFGLLYESDDEATKTPVVPTTITTKKIDIKNLRVNTNIPNAIDDSPPTRRPTKTKRWADYESDEDNK